MTDMKPCDIPPGLKSAHPLTAMQQNNIPLDSRHTLLTPEHLERLAQGKPLQPDTDKTDTNNS